MPHSLSRSLDTLENTIDLLLRQGARISEALENQVEYAENQYGEGPKSGSRSSSGVTSTVSSKAKPNGSSSKNISTKSPQSVSVDSDKTMPLSSVRSSERSTTPTSSQFSPIQVPSCVGMPISTKSRCASTSSSSAMTHTFDVDDISSLPFSFTQFSGASNSRASASNSSFWSSADASFTLPPKQPMDITSDMLVPPASSVISNADDTPINDAMPKHGDVFIGVHSYPCFLRNEDQEVIERVARVSLTRRANSNWIVMFFEVDDVDDRKLIVLRCELLGRLVRNVHVNGQRVQ